MSFDSVQANRAFADKQGYPFRLLCDTERALGLAYRACNRKSDPFPRRITYVVGPDGKIEQALETGSPGEQAGELLTSCPVRS